MIVASAVAGTATFDPEPEAATPLGTIVVTLLLMASQIPLAVAPFAPNATSRVRVRVLLAMGMLPTALLILFIAVDLAPRVLSSRATNGTLIVVLAIAAVAYTLGFLTLRRTRPRAAE